MRISPGNNKAYPFAVIADYRPIRQLVIITLMNLLLLLLLLLLTIFTRLCNVLQYEKLHIIDRNGTTSIHCFYGFYIYHEFKFCPSLLDTANYRKLSVGSVSDHQ